MAATGSTLRSWNPNYKKSDRERWSCVYPVYINSRKTVAEGRRIAKEKAVDNPTVAEIRDVLTASGVPVLVEDKVHPRERDRNAKGRVRVQLKDENDAPINEQFQRKDDILEYVCQMIPKLKTRSQSHQSSSSQAATGQSSAGSTGGKKNKGKKK